MVARPCASSAVSTSWSTTRRSSRHHDEAFWEIGQAEGRADGRQRPRACGWPARGRSPDAATAAVGGSIHISSAAIFMGRPNTCTTSASKAPCFAMTRAMARELGDFGITVNTITPGATFTEIPRETGDPRAARDDVRASVHQAPGRTARPRRPPWSPRLGRCGLHHRQTITVNGGLTFY